MGRLWLSSMFLLVIGCMPIESASLSALSQKEVSQFPVLPRPAIPKGIPNLAMTCFFNSLLQSLYNTTFIEHLHEMYKTDRLKDARLCNELHKFFTKFRAASKITNDDVENLYNSLRPFKKAVTEEPILDEHTCMQDPFRVFAWFYPILKHEFYLAKEPDPFCFSYKRYKDGKEIESKPNEFSLPLEGTGETGVYSVQATLEKFEKEVTGSKVYSNKFTKLPEILIFQANVKAGERVIALDEITLEEKLLDDSIKAEKATYKLVAMPLYRSTQGRHYTALTWSGSQWYFVNDATVESLKGDQVRALLKDGYFVHDSGRYCARMLMYQRRDASHGTSSASLQSELSQLSAQLHALSTQF